jgi:hypothetical protein
MPEVIDANERSGWRRAWRRAALLAAVIASGAYLALLTWIYCCQERLIFRPEPLPLAHRFVLDDVHEVSIDVGGETLSALHLQLPNPQRCRLLPARQHRQPGDLVYPQRLLPRRQL